MSRDATDRRELDLLHRELSALEQGRSQLQAAVITQQEANKHRRALLSRGSVRVSRSQRLKLFGVVAALLLSGAAAYHFFHQQAGLPRSSTRVYRPLTPHLLVTSTPAGAQVTVDGQARGLTPQLIATPAGSYQARVARPGYLPQTRALTLSPQAGKHWHVELTPQPGGPAEVEAAERPLQ